MSPQLYCKDCSKYYDYELDRLNQLYHEQILKQFSSFKNGIYFSNEDVQFTPEQLKNELNYLLSNENVNAQNRVIIYIYRLLKHFARSEDENYSYISILQDFSINSCCYFNHKPLIDVLGCENEVCKKNSNKKNYVYDKVLRIFYKTDKIRVLSDYEKTQKGKEKTDNITILEYILNEKS